MKNTLQHPVIRRRTLLQGPAIAGLALAIPLGSGAQAAARQSMPAHLVATAVLSGPHSRTAVPAHGGAPGGDCNGALATATLMPFSEHMNHAHLPFAAAGTYAYYCAIHPDMTGTVVVQ